MGNRYFDAYDKILLNSDIYLAVCGFKKSIKKAVLAGMEFVQMKNILEIICFRYLREYSGQYFGRIYSLVAQK